MYTTRTNKVGGVIAKGSLVFAVCAYLPSIVPFTPALLRSILAFFGATIGAFCGWIRVALLTIYIAIATFLVSPVSLWVEGYIKLSLLIIGLAVTGVIISGILYIHYRKALK